MKIDFSNIDEVQDFSPIPNGRYLCEIIGIEETSTRNGDAMWKIQLEVSSGEYEGRCLFDNLVFSEKCLGRVKLFWASIGLDVSGEVDVTPDLAECRTCNVEVGTEEYKDAVGVLKRSNFVPFAGYLRAGAESGDEPPF